MPVRVFTKINGKLACWEATAGEDYKVSIEAVKNELGPDHKVPVLALVKY